jgi:hypothetical protein
MLRARGRRSASTVAAAAAIVALLAPSATMGHEGGEAFIHVPADHIVQGGPFPVVGADLGQNAVVALRLGTGGRVVSLGTVTAGPDGHFEATVVIPESVGDGYAQLVAQGADGSVASTWVRVGTAGAPGQPLPGTAVQRLDPSLLVAGAGFLVITAVLVARGRLRRAGQARC